MFALKANYCKKLPSILNFQEEKMTNESVWNKKGKIYTYVKCIGISDFYFYEKKNINKKVEKRLKKNNNNNKHIHKLLFSFKMMVNKITNRQIEKCIRKKDDILKWI